MLVLTRKVGETIHINDDIVITLTKIEQGWARISIEAPREVPIWRGELYREIQQQKGVSE